MPSPVSNVLALDRGSKRIGVAYALAQTPDVILPLGHIANDGEAYFHILSFVTQYRIQTIVIGYPQRIQHIRDRIMRFGQSIQKMVDESVQVVYMEEDYSSVQSQDILGHFSTHSGIDTVSAMIILERRQHTRSTE